MSSDEEKNKEVTEKFKDKFLTGDVTVKDLSEGDLTIEEVTVEDNNTTIKIKGTLKPAKVSGFGKDEQEDYYAVYRIAYPNDRVKGDTIKVYGKDNTDTPITTYTIGDGDGKPIITNVSGKDDKRVYKFYHSDKVDSGEPYATLTVIFDVTLTPKSNSEPAAEEPAAEEPAAEEAPAEEAPAEEAPAE